MAIFLYLPASRLGYSSASVATIHPQRSRLRFNLTILQKCIPKANMSNNILLSELLSQKASLQQTSTTLKSVGSSPLWQSVRRQKSLLMLHNRRYSGDLIAFRCCALSTTDKNCPQHSDDNVGLLRAPATKSIDKDTTYSEASRLVSWKRGPQAGTATRQKRPTARARTKTKTDSSRSRANSPVRPQRPQSKHLLWRLVSYCSLADRNSLGTRVLVCICFRCWIMLFGAHEKVIKLLSS